MNLVEACHIALTDCCDTYYCLDSPALEPRVKITISVGQLTLSSLVALESLRIMVSERDLMQLVIKLAPPDSTIALVV